MNDLQRAIITRIVSDAVGDGYALEVFNGEETMIRHSRDEREIMAALETTGEDQLRFRREGKRAGFVRLVYANPGGAWPTSIRPASRPSWPPRARSRKASSRARCFLAIEAFLYQIHTGLTDNGVAFADLPKHRTVSMSACISSDGPARNTASRTS